MMDFSELKRITDSYMSVRTLQVATDIKLFDILASESRTSEGVAEALKTEPRATELLCNALAGMDLLTKENGKFSNTGISEKYLVTSSPLYYGWIIRHNSRLWESWGKLGESIKTGQPVPRKEIPERENAEMEDFIMGMHSIIVARGDAETLSDKLKLEDCETMLDLGGGPATFSITFCTHHKNLKATVFDLPETVKIAKKNLNKYPEVKDRVDFVEGNFFEDELPKGFDMIFISNIIHMNDEKGNEDLIKKAFDALNPGGRIIIKDHIMNDDLTLPSHGSLFAIHMLLHTKGRDYSQAECEDWFKKAGCTNTYRIELPESAPFGLVAGAN